MNLSINKSDSLGVFSSVLCLIHCLATPLLFVTQAQIMGIAKPVWWSYVDYILLVVSFFAIYKSTKVSSNSFVKKVLWISWLALTFLIINEKLEWLSLPELLIFIPTFSLIIFHTYNSFFCKCPK